MNLTTKLTRKREFLAHMERVVPWAELVALIAPYAPEGNKGRPPLAVETTLHIHLMQWSFTWIGPEMEAALHDLALFREFAGPSGDSRFLTRASYWGFATCWQSISWPSRCSPRSTSFCTAKA